MVGMELKLHRSAELPSRNRNVTCLHPSWPPQMVRQWSSKAETGPRALQKLPSRGNRPNPTPGGVQYDDDSRPNKDAKIDAVGIIKTGGGETLATKSEGHSHLDCWRRIYSNVTAQNTKCKKHTPPLKANPPTVGSSIKTNPLDLKPGRDTSQSIRRGRLTRTATRRHRGDSRTAGCRRLECLCEMIDNSTQKIINH
jgi:hypothetical protein